MTARNSGKEFVEEIALLGGKPLYAVPISTSNLVQPSFDRFLSYSEQFFEARQYTNNGPLSTLLEQRLAVFHDVQYCVGFCSGFWALVLAMKALALPGRNEVIMPSLTYRRMADIAAWARLIPRFCEVDSTTLAVSRDTAADCINDQTALILGVHPIVNCCDVEGLQSLSEDTGIPLLFDSVESAYESIRIGKIGQFGDAECFSMHASKLLNGFEGGYLTTNDRQLAEKLQKQRTFGFFGQDNSIVSGSLNAKLNEVHAAMALANLDQIEEQITRNRERYRCYQDGLSKIEGLRLLEFDEDFGTSYKNIVVEVLDNWPFTRDETVEMLNRENILARAYYSPPLHRKKMRYPHIPCDLGSTDRLALKFLLLPCGEFVSEDDITAVLQLLKFIQIHAADIKECVSVAGSRNHE